LARRPPAPAVSARHASASLRSLANRADAALLKRFFKTGRGQYGEGDRFLGIRVPETRRVSREFRDMPLREMPTLLRSPWHEERLLALVILSDRYARGDDETRERIYRLYLASMGHVNNWDLVDLSAPNIVGAHLAGRSRTPLDALAQSENLWERRIAIVATHWFIRNGEVAATLRIAKMLLEDPHDLIHKASGWMLREAAKRDRAAVERFLKQHQRSMPRTMLRYAIERFPASVRTRYLAGTA
jgi:3-methyladenine DNA glycosylase AlkD